MKGLVIAAPKSGGGKTTVALGLMAAWRKKGLTVAGFKVGPDFIDPGHHRRILGKDSENLDGWMLSKDENRRLFFEKSNAHIAVVEGVMGLFDGKKGKDAAGSTAQMAKWLGLPALFVVDASGMAASAAALIKGFETFDPNLSFCGILFNQVSGERHLDYLKSELPGNVKTPFIGGIFKNERLKIPSRHLGLVTACEHMLSEKDIQILAEHIAACVDLDGLYESLPDIHPAAPAEKPRRKKHPAPVRIAVARDEAFCFYYPENLKRFSAAGGDIVFFSPLADQRPPTDACGFYFGGGYPEVFAKQLSQNRVMREFIRGKSAQGAPIYAECGGFMYLCRTLTDEKGRSHPMAGVFPIHTAMFSRRRALGYRAVETRRKTPLGPAGQIIKGHEFHYSDITKISGPVATAYETQSGYGEKPAKGYIVQNTVGGYVHLHFGSAPDPVENFITVCKEFEK